MDALSSVDVCILLVDSNVASSSWVSSLLLKSKYKVLTAETGGDALGILINQQHDVNMVLTDTNLPDMCSFDFVRTVDKQTQLPVVMICDCYNQSSMKAFTSGAILCLVKPLLFDNIKDLWRFTVLKQRGIIPESRRFLTGISKNGHGMEPTKPESSSGSRKRKMDELERLNGWSLGKSSFFIWTPDGKRKCQKVVQDLRISQTVLSEVAGHINAPGLTTKHMAERWQRFRVYVQQYRFRSEMVCLDATSSMSPNPLYMAAQPVDPSADMNDGLLFKEEGISHLSRYLENPHSREQLKRVIVVAMAKWGAAPSAMVGAPTPNPPPLEVPPVFLPVALAQAIEKFIHTTMAVERSPPGFLHEVASQVASTGPSASSELPDGEELEPGFLEELDTDDIFDAIEELLES